MFHLAAFAGANTDSTNNENVPAVSDQGLTTSGNSRYLSPADLMVIAAFAENDAIARARITAPSLRNTGLPEIYPLHVVAETTGDLKYAFWGQNGPRLKRNEEFGVEASCGVSTVNVTFAALWLMERMDPVPAGKRMTIVGTSAQTLVANAWTLGGITLDQVLPTGRYAVIGMHCTCNDAIFARLQFPRGGQWRPGVAVTNSVGGYDPQGIFRAGRLGDWGQFDSVAGPQLELLGGTAGAETATVILDLVQVSSDLG